MKAIMVGILVLLFGKVALCNEPLPESIRQCITDQECEEAARVLCATGHDEWCIEVGEE